MGKPEKDRNEDTEIPPYRLLAKQEMPAVEVYVKISVDNTLITTFGGKYNEYSSIFSM